MNPFTYCPICGHELHTSDRVPRWVHDINKHRGYWKMQTGKMTKLQLEKVLFQICDYYKRSEIYSV